MLRRMSARAVLDALRAGGPMTGSDLMAATGINRSTVHEICNGLIGLGWIRELVPRSPAGGSGRGRRARVYEFDADAGRVVGLSAGLTSVTAYLADLRGDVIASACEPLPWPPDGARAIHARFERVRTALVAVLDAAGAVPGDVFAAGLGVAWPLPVPGHEVWAAPEESGAAPAAGPADLRRALSVEFGWPVQAGPDAALAALAERWRGAAAECDDFVMLLAGERLGAGIFTGGRPVTGHAGAAGELRLGNGTGGVADQVEAAAAAAGLDGDAAAVLGEAGHGDAKAMAVVDEVAGRLAVAVGAMTAVLDPELVVVGGSPGGADPVLADRMRLALGGDGPRVLASTLGGDDAVALGGVRLALDLVESGLFDTAEAEEARFGGNDRGATARGGRRAGSGTGGAERTTTSSNPPVDLLRDRSYSAETIRQSRSAGGTGQRPGIKDVAALAGVSPSTVSVVLNDVHGARVADDTRRRISAAADELGYAPDPLARGLRTRRSNLIGFVSDDIATTPYAGQMIQGAQDTAWKSGLLLVLVSTGGDDDLEAHAMRALRQRRVDGIVYATMFHRVVDPPRLSRDLPAVLLDARPSDGELPFVAPDEVGGAATAVRELLDHGHRRIGFVTVAAPGAATDGRLEGYRATLATAGIAFDAELVEFEASDSLGGYHAAGRLLDLPDRPTAVFCFNDEMAVGVYRAAAERGLGVPGDLSVIGYDDHELIAASLNPGLTSVALPHYDMGAMAMETLLGLTGDRPASTRPPGYLMPCPLVRRGSVGPPPTAPRH
jgi:LacI family transcriptional regulator